MGTQMYSRFVDDISIKMWVAKDAVDATIQKVKLALNSWHACIKIDPIVHIVTDPLGGNDSSIRSDFLDVSESYRIVSGRVRIETSIFRKMPGYMHAPFSSALPSAVKLGTVISQRIRYITICFTEEAFDTAWGPYHAYFLRIGYSGGMLAKITQGYPYLSRAGLLARMDTKADRRGFTSWDENDAVERVVPLVLGARPGTRDYWREFKNLRLDSCERRSKRRTVKDMSDILNKLLIAPGSQGTGVFWISKQWCKDKTNGNVKEELDPKGEQLFCGCQNSTSSRKRSKVSPFVGMGQKV